MAGGDDRTAGAGTPAEGETSAAADGAPPADRTLGVPTDALVVLAGPVLWALLLVVDYAILGAACSPAGAGGASPVTGSWAAVVAISNLGGAALVGWTGWLALGRYRAVRATERPGAAGREGVTGFLSLFGAVTSGLFAIGILLLGIGPLALGCAAAP